MCSAERQAVGARDRDAGALEGADDQLRCGRGAGPGPGCRRRAPAGGLARSRSLARPASADATGDGGGHRRSGSSVTRGVGERPPARARPRRRLASGQTSTRPGRVLRLVSWRTVSPSVTPAAMWGWRGRGRRPRARRGRSGRRGRASRARRRARRRWRAPPAPPHAAEVRRGRRPGSCRSTASRRRRRRGCGAAGARPRRRRTPRSALDDRPLRGLVSCASSTRTCSSRGRACRAPSRAGRGPPGGGRCARSGRRSRGGALALQALVLVDDGVAEAQQGGRAAGEDERVQAVLQAQQARLLGDQRGQAGGAQALAAQALAALALGGEEGGLYSSR